MEYDPAIVHKKYPGTWWPVGEHVVEYKELKRLLARSSQWHARQTIRFFTSTELDELLQAAVSAGTAVELLAKAYLASINCALLADRGHRDTVLLLGGHGAMTTVRPLHMKTIGAVEALDLVKYLHKDFPWLSRDQVSLHVRNAAIHMALVQSDELRAAVVQMTRIIESLLALLALERESFWGPDEVSVVDYLMDEAQTEIARIVAAKKAAAQRRLDDLLSGLRDESRQIILAALSSKGPSVYTDHEEPYPCPVCDQRGWLSCTVERGTGRHMPAGEGTDVVLASRSAYPVTFDCPVCELSLEDEELWQFHFPSSIDLEPEEVGFEESDTD